MRIFGGEKIANLMDFIGADEEMPIEHRMVTRSIEGAQKKVEAHHFDMRKHVLQYDDVLNTQREVIYRERRRVLANNDLRENIVDMMSENLDLVLAANIDHENPPEMWEENGLPEVLQILEADIPLIGQLTVAELSGMQYEDVREKIWKAILQAYEVREKELGTATMRELERQILLRTIDTKWVDYLHNIELLRDGVGLRGYGQRDPLQEYKREAFDMFNLLLRHIQQESIQLVFRAQPMSRQESDFEMEEIPEEFLQSLPPELLEALASGQVTFQDENGQPLPPELLQALAVSGITLHDPEKGDVDVGSLPPDELKKFVNSITLAPADAGDEDDDEEDDDDEELDADAVAAAINGTSGDGPHNIESEKSDQDNGGKAEASEVESKATSEGENADVLNNLGNVDDVIHNIRGDEDDTKHDTAVSKGSKKKTPPVVK